MSVKMYANIVSTIVLFLTLIAVCQFTYNPGHLEEPLPEDVDTRFNSSNQNLLLGERTQGDRLLNNTIVELEPFWRSHVSYIFQHPAKTDKEIAEILITLVNVTNLMGKDGGYPILLKGGPQSNNVTVYIASQLSKGIHFKIEIYGKDAE